MGRRYGRNRHSAELSQGNSVDFIMLGGWQGYEIGLKSFGSKVLLNLRVAECVFIQGAQSELLLPLHCFS